MGNQKDVHPDPLPKGRVATSYIIVLRENIYNLC